MNTFLILGSITLLAAISPGPDFIVVVKNALQSKKQGYMTSLGVASAIFVHIAYCIAGLGLIISQSILLFQTIKIIGALYLIYLSYLLFSTKPNSELNTGNAKKVSLLEAFKEGFLTNVLNPKATIFFLSVFAQVISPDTTLGMQILYGIFMACIVCIWFMTLSNILGTKLVKKHLSFVNGIVNKLMGGILFFLGIKILTQTR